MSYCRLSDESDVYVYMDADGGFTCCFCKFGEEFFNVDFEMEMVLHLMDHRVQGNKVPQCAIDQLMREANHPLGRC